MYAVTRGRSFQLSARAHVELRAKGRVLLRAKANGYYGSSSMFCMSVVSSRPNLASSARYSSRQRSAVRGEIDTSNKRVAARATLRTIGPRNPGRYPARATEIAPAVQAAFLDFYFDVCKADVVDIDLLAIGDRNLVEPGPQRRQIVIGELGVDGPREFHARS